MMLENKKNPQRPIYMDHHATTPVDPRVLEAMLPYFGEVYGNAASIDHEYGREAGQAVEVARRQVAGLINAQPDEIIITSGATEANNLAILGIAEQYRERGDHIITCVTEHKAVLDPCKYLESKGWHVTRLAVDSQGLIDPDSVLKAITARTVLISIMTANNEIGTIAPVAEIGRIAHEREVLFHTDATQAVGHIPMDVETMSIDLLSLSAHKMYGPKGVGALYVRKRSPRVKLTPQLHGGGHERGMRSGTMNVPGIVGMGKAADVAGREMKKAGIRLLNLKEQLWAGLQERLDGVHLNGHPVKRLPHNLSVAISGVESRSLLLQLKHEVALSTGSACTTAKVEPSHVIMALGFGEERAHTSIRFGVGRVNTESEVGSVVESLTSVARHLRHIGMLR